MKYMFLTEETTQTVDVNCDDVFLSILPLHHVFECTVGFLFPLYKGAKIVFCDGIRHIVDNLKEYNASVILTTPTVPYKAVLSSAKLIKVLLWASIHKKTK